jgi:Holliday junction DNA helicase RuvA
MYAYIKGTLVSATPAQVILDVNGIGYILYIPHRVLEQLPALGHTMQLFSTFVVREFAHSLYGFISEHERDVFEVLMNITGIGPKLALSLIGHLPLPALQEAIMIQDIRTLCKVPGVGKKTAERLIVELKDKLAHLLHFDMADYALEARFDPKSQTLQDAVLALINLGYTQSVAQKAVKQSLKELNDEADLATLITLALKFI